MKRSYLYIGTWFTEGLAGIRPNAENPGYKHFMIRPYVPSNQKLDWVKAKLESPYGAITSQWEIQNDILKLEVTIPPNTTASVYIPNTELESIKESNNSISETKGVKYLRKENKYSVLDVQSGHFSFEINGINDGSISGLFAFHVQLA